MSPPKKVKKDLTTGSLVVTFVASGSRVTLLTKKPWEKKYYANH